MTDSAAAAASLQALSLEETGSPFPQHLPVSLVKSYEILGVVSDCWVMLFGDQIVLGISQLGGKVGTFILVQVEETALDNKTRFNISTLLGKRDDPVWEVYARRVTERIAAMRASRADVMPPVVLGISLKPQEGKDPKMFAEVVDVLVNLYSEAIQKVAR